MYTAGNMAILNGDKMTFDPAIIEEGIFLINIADNAATRIESYAQTGAKEVIFLFPSGLTGEFRLEVRTKYQGKVLKIGMMKGTLLTAKQ